MLVTDLRKDFANASLNLEQHGRAAVRGSSTLCGRMADGSCQYGLELAQRPPSSSVRGINTPDNPTARSEGR
jgi:hypothetical protein